jgi:hypothetical protein
VGRACGTHVMGRNVYRVLVGNPEDHLKDQGTDGRMGSKWSLGSCLRGGVDWIHLTEDRDCWQTLVNAVMNLQALTPQS